VVCSCTAVQYRARIEWCVAVQMRDNSPPSEPTMGAIKTLLGEGGGLEHRNLMHYLESIFGNIVPWGDIWRC
jgi:hypothetical protein